MLVTVGFSVMRIAGAKDRKLINISSHEIIVSWAAEQLRMFYEFQIDKTRIFQPRP